MTKEFAAIVKEADDVVAEASSLDNESSEAKAMIRAAVIRLAPPGSGLPRV
jgi:hypothetical protein